MSVSEAVLAFSSGQPPWVQDALRRLATKAELQDEDLRALLQILKADHGVPQEDSPPVAEPLSPSHLTPVGPAGMSVVLRELSGVKRANRLAEGQCLRFAVDGITLIYGDNGSGKSGYCRLLKKLCRIREGAEERILPDAYKGPSAQPAEATVRFSEGLGQEQTITWLDGSSPPPVLRRISVFDAKAAPLYVDREGKIEFLPQGLDLLPRLGALLGVLAQHLTAEIEGLQARLRVPLPSFAESTDVKLAVARLVPQTALAELPAEDKLRSLGRWDQKDAIRLTELGQTLADNAAAMATVLERAAEGARALIERLSSWLALLSDGKLEALRDTVLAARAARRDADVAASTFFEREPLPGIGSDTWRSMLKHAEHFSATAYPQQPFPVIGPGSRCVLCQQPLTDEGSERLRRFAEYVRGVTETVALRHETETAAAREALEALTLGDDPQTTTALSGFNDPDPTLKADAEACLAALTTRRTAALAFVSGLSSELFLGSSPPDPSKRLSELAGRCDRRASTLRAVRTDAELRQHLENERLQLNARALLAENLTAVIGRRSDLVRLHQLVACRTACDTTSVSRRNTDLRRQFITDEFKARLEVERSHFGIGYLPVKVGDRSDRGTSFVGIALDAVSPVKTHDVLSEGERTALALACFFAEIGGNPENNGIILDDPVSSLDHRHRHRVAQRIVRAAGSARQVVVFTHDLVFYHELQAEAAAATPQVPVVTHEVVRTEEFGFGTVNEGAQPWFAAKVVSRLPKLEKRLAGLKGVPDEGSSEYREAVVAYYADLRDTWERLVEDELLNGVVTRFSQDVKTQSLAGVLVEDEDHKRVFFAMKRASEWSGHSRPPASQNSTPDHATAAHDLEELRGFLRLVTHRKRQVEENRKDLQKPPAATLG